MEQLVVKEKSGANYLLFELDGSITAYTLSDLPERVYADVRDGHVVLDLSKTNEIDYSGLGFIMAAFNDAEHAGNKLFLLTPSPESLHALSETGFIDVFHIIHSLAELI